MPVSFKSLKTKVGHFTNNKTKTGCTILLFDKLSPCGYHTAGGAPGTRETDLLDPSMLVIGVNGILLTGGSAFGLASADGVMNYCADKKIGFRVGSDLIPIIPSAVIYDRSVGERSAPTAKDGYNSAKNADYISKENGRFGAGTGATIGKWSARLQPQEGGISLIKRKIGKITYGAVMVVNAFGNIIDPSTGSTVAGAKDKKGDIVPFSLNGRNRPVMGNTTIGVIVTDAFLTKASARRVAMSAHSGLARTIHPSHTLYDGDTIFVVSTGKKKESLQNLSVAVADISSQAILKAVE